MSKRIFAAVSAALCAACAMAFDENTLAFYSFNDRPAGSAAVVASIRPEQSAIVLAKGVTPLVAKSLMETAQELKLHLDLIGGTDIPIVTNGEVKARYVFHVGETPPGANGAFADEEAHWRVSGKDAWFYGSYHNGVSFAVTSFLEDELGVRWPWHTNIAFRAQNPIVVRHAEGVYRPPVAGHNFRRMRWDPAPIWRTRMRNGAHDVPSYGHSFVGFGKRFAKTHPEWFAMRADGQRLPAGVPPGTPVDQYVDKMDRMSMCLTAPGLAEQVVEDWRRKAARPWINCCDNDVYASQLCQCEKCKELDCERPTDTPKGRYDYFSDRGVWFAKRVLALARKVRPDVRACIYAYNGTERAPQRERIENGEIAVMVVPTRFSMKRIDQLFTEWRAAGFKDFGVRPNRHGYYRVTALPVGNERHFFDVWHREFDLGAKWFDYDCAQRNYPVEYLRDYMLYKAMQDPTKPFEYWERHYMQAFGVASDDVRAYFRHWREEVWAKRISEFHENSDERGGYFIRPLFWKLGTFYRESDFDQAGAYLDRALRLKSLDPADRERVEELRVCNEHGRLFYRAVVDKNDSDRDALYKFRKAHDIPTVMWEENYIQDVTGVKKYLYDHGLAEDIPEYIRAKDERIRKVLAEQKAAKAKEAADRKAAAEKKAAEAKAASRNARRGKGK